MQIVRVDRFSSVTSEYHSIHSFIRENFEKGSVTASHKNKDSFIVLSNKIPDFLDKKNQVIRYAQHEFHEKKTINLECNIAHDNRHKSGERIFAKPINSSEILKIFCEKSGLVISKKNEVVCEFMGIVKEKKFNIHNAFKIEGEFDIEDVNLFNKALKDGVGSRRSYGFGLILVHEII